CPRRRLSWCGWNSKKGLDGTEGAGAYLPSKEDLMAKIEILTPEPEKALLILQDAIAWQKRLLLQSLARTQERVQELAVHLQVDPDLLLTGGGTASGGPRYGPPGARR